MMPIHARQRVSARRGLSGRRYLFPAAGQETKRQSCPTHPWASKATCKSCVMAGEGRPPTTLLCITKKRRGWPAFAGHDTPRHVALLAPCVIDDRVGPGRDGPGAAADLCCFQPAGQAIARHYPPYKQYNTYNRRGGGALSTSPNAGAPRASALPQPHPSRARPAGPRRAAPAPRPPPSPAARTRRSKPTGQRAMPPGRQRARA